jgi:hypothetical protein
MTVATAAPGIGDRAATPAALVNASFVLFVVNVSAFLALSVSHSWIFDAQGRGIPTDFINVWSAGKLALDGHPALAWDWASRSRFRSRCLARIMSVILPGTIRRRSCWSRRS